MTLRLNGSTSGYTEIDAPAVAGSNTVILPSGNGSANQFLKNGSTAGSLGWSSMVETATGVGIGTNSPQAPLDITGNVAAEQTLFVNNTNASGYTALRLGNSDRGTNGDHLVFGGTTLGIRAKTGAAITFETAATERMRIGNDGAAYFNTTSRVDTCALTIKNPGTTARWGVGSTASFGNFYVINPSGTGVYLSDGGTSWTANSDERLKTDLLPIEDGLSKVGTLRAVTGRYKTDPEGTSRSFLIAQEVQAVLPEAVCDVNPDALGLAYADVIPLLVAAIKESKERIESLEAANADLEARIAALEVTP